MRPAFVLLALALAASMALAEEPVGGLRYLASTGSEGDRAANGLAERLGGASLVTANGSLAIPEGCRVLWWHSESWPWPAEMSAEPTRQAIRAWLEKGGGLLLSGTALAWSASLGLEPGTPRVGSQGAVDTQRSGVTPTDAQHPIFAGLDGGAVWLNSAGYPPFSDFWGTGPECGTVLGRALPDAGENPLVEWAYGKGRILALGWRLPRYAEGNTDLPTLERLTANALRYLGGGSWWGQLDDARTRVALRDLEGIRPASLRMLVRDLRETWGARYPRASEHLADIERFESLRARVAEGDESALEEARALAPRLRALPLDNPLLDFDELLLVRRGEGNMGLPANWESNSSLPRTGFDNEIAVLSPVRPDGELRTVYRPSAGEFVGDVDLAPEGDRVVFSMPREGGPWRVWQMSVDGAGLNPIPQPEQPDVDNYDACFLPSGNWLYTSTATFAGVPCVTGASHVANLFLTDRARGSRIRQLTFEQDHDWCPTVMPDGRVLYLRWEYSDLPHFVSRILFSMNPDGTDQRAFYGTNSYWPNSMFYARLIPGSESRFITVVVGHHDTARAGELVLFDAAQGQHEAEGAVQRIPGHGKPVVATIRDGLTAASWPKFLHPWPLSEKQFLVSMKPSPSAPWGIWLADVFDNLTLVKELPGQALLEPIPLRPSQPAPAVPERVDPARHDATVYLSDVYSGPGLAGIPRGEVKRLRLVSYQFAYRGVGGQTCRVGFDGPWDVKRILGTVPVEPDGSARFRIPANTPISLQPLDANGQALQLMRSWFTAMPGETISCVGCHEQRGTAPPPVALASTSPLRELEPWRGPARGFSFEREVQPVLDRHCVGCHDGRVEGGVARLDLRSGPPVQMGAPSSGYNDFGWFPPSYLALKPWVRNATIESDMHLLTPGEFAADTTRLMRLLADGHGGVRLDRESWEALATWIDLNTPGHGTWHEIVGWDRVREQRDRRRAMQVLYAGRDEDPEAELGPDPLPDLAPAALAPAPPLPAPEALAASNAPGAERVLRLAPDVSLRLRLVPASEGGKPLWVGECEVTNRQYRAFAPSHDSRLETGDFLQFGEEERGWSADAPEQPVVRVSALEAEAFCRWLSARSGLRVRLPAEGEWERACRAGTTTPLWFGSETDDFAAFANLADAQLRRIENIAPWSIPRDAIPPWRPAVEGVDDGFRVCAPVGSFAANPWGLRDMHGNAAEWTASIRTPPGSPASTAQRVVRGGSWYDLPRYARSDTRGAYPAWRRVFDVGFRVVVEAE